MLKGTRFFFAEDRGISKEDVLQYFDALPEERLHHLDLMVAILVEDPDARMTVTGVASPRATNIQGKHEEASEEHNAELAEMRAKAGIEFIKDYALRVYGKDISSQLIPASRVADGSTGDNQPEDRAIEFVVH